MKETLDLRALRKHTDIVSSALPPLVLSLSKDASGGSSSPPIWFDKLTMSGEEAVYTAA